ncbi:arsenate-mycothiol transferase ArsC [Gephyromycinifex aptenodytis]|uniref:arsenate-mycothiol transferase ArsC n=1 Tax=Gephyromycinifex aptenodytis TaxID=2716227 RepID=UPI0014450415|nr:arsenate reductase ArsC [Gephyromycinifex aptenodytis]
MTLHTEDLFDRITDELAYRYEGTFSRSEVTSQVMRSRAELEPTSRHPEFLPVLVEKHARDQLLASASAQGRLAKATPEILFVCVHNEGRSQMAAALAEHLSEGRVHVRSAGAHPTGIINPLVVEALRERGIELEHAYPTALSGDILQASDVVVRMGTTLDASPGYRSLDWDVADPQHQPLDVVRAIRDDLEERVIELLQDLDIPVRATALTPTAPQVAARPVRDMVSRFQLPWLKVG